MRGRSERGLAVNHQYEKRIRTFAALCAGLAAFGLGGCGSRPVVTDSASLWPFEQLTIRTSVGAVRSYLYKPQDTAVRFIVALQSSPCPTSEERDDMPLLNTNGVVWDQFKYDSMFFQFERPGGMSDEHSVVVMCERADRSGDWHEALVDSLKAVRKREHLEGVPTTYLGVGRGAALALSTALRDPESKSIVLMSAALSASETEDVAKLAAKTRGARPSILFLHGADYAGTPVEQIENVANRLSAAHVPTKMIVFDDVGADFGLTGMQSDCFDLAALSVSQYVRFDQPEIQRLRVACAAQAPTMRRDGLRIQRL
jgi:predicted esterase